MHTQTVRETGSELCPGFQLFIADTGRETLCAGYFHTGDRFDSFACLSADIAGAAGCEENDFLPLKS